MPGAELVLEYDPRDADELAEYQRIEAEVTASLTDAGLDDLVPLLETNLFGVQLDPRVSTEVQAAGRPAARARDADGRVRAAARGRPVSADGTDAHRGDADRSIAAGGADRRPPAPVRPRDRAGPGGDRDRPTQRRSVDPDRRQRADRAARPRRVQPRPLPAARHLVVGLAERRQGPQPPRTAAVRPAGDPREAVRRRDRRGARRRPRQRRGDHRHGAGRPPCRRPHRRTGRGRRRRCARVHPGQRDVDRPVEPARAGAAGAVRARVHVGRRQR